MKMASVFVTAFLLWSCAGNTPALEGDLSYPAEEVMENSFSRFYEEIPSPFEPQMEQMGLPVDADKVINLQDVLQPVSGTSVPDMLLENGFAVFPMSYPADNPVTVFEQLESSGKPVFVSSGIALHLLHIFFDQILQQVESDHLYRELVTICSELYQSSLNRNDLIAAAYFAVPLVFLEDSFTPDAQVKDMVEEEVNLMKNHGGFAESPIFGYREDYSQYIPRGHYTASEELENYFMAMMYMGRLTFLLKGGEPNGSDGPFLISAELADRLTESALYAVSDLNSIEADGETLKVKWQRVYEITAFFAGFADDLSVPQYHAAAEAVAGETPEASIVRTDQFLSGFRGYIAENFAGPSIYSGTGESMVIPDGDGQFSPEEFQPLLEKTAGFRLFGQRHTPDSEILGKFVFPSVSTNPRGEQRFMPSGLDVAAAFRCEAALDILENDGTMEYANYPDTLAAMQEMVDGYSEDDWHATLYMCWLHSLRLLAAERGEGYPDFMQTDMWGRQTLSTFLASWAMLRHDTILYVKQSYTALACCAPPMGEPVPSAGFVEPVPEVYAELRSALRTAQNGLEHYGLLDDDAAPRFRNAELILSRLQGIAEKELAGELLSAEDADFLKSFAASLEGTIAWGGNTTEGLETSLIADVHTDQNSGSVLEAASGNLDYCVIIYRRPDGIIEAAAGPVLSYYQFNWPMGDRLTDEKWRDMLEQEPPARPEWTSEYIQE
ncbi:hypothetical protein CSA37_01315 [Candidatus Fermentibacteria bacterium]|nr:MAG: hypothetical protein CSA37_01315 [Candidatus Fermentibacteria bacterium]